VNAADVCRSIGGRLSFSFVSLSVAARDNGFNFASEAGDTQRFFGRVPQPLYQGAAETHKNPLKRN
jgi:hypothetical protein